MRGVGGGGGGFEGVITHMCCKGHGRVAEHGGPNRGLELDYKARVVQVIMTITD